MQTAGDNRATLLNISDYFSRSLRNIDEMQVLIDGKNMFYLVGTVLSKMRNKADVVFLVNIMTGKKRCQKAGPFVRMSP